MIGIGIIGYGYWGPNLVRNFAETPGARVVAVSDLLPERLAKVSARYPAIKTTTDYRELLSDASIDAVAIATPVSTHYALALEALRASKHVLVEKPLVETVEQAQRLLDEAARRNRIVMVDHTFVYTGAVRRIKEIVTSGRLGPIYYYDSVRVNLGLLQRDVNVLWDLAVHDLAILDYVLGEKPCAVSAVGMRHVGPVEDIAYLTCLFDKDLIAHIHANWLAPVKVRRTLIGGAKQMIVYDDLEPSEKVKVYDKGVTLSGNGHGGDGNNGNGAGATNGNGANGVYQMLVGYRMGDMWAPQLPMNEALHDEIAHLVDCIEHGRQPETDGHAGLRVVHILESANESLRQQGRPVELHWERISA